MRGNSRKGLLWPFQLEFFPLVSDHSWYGINALGFLGEIPGIERVWASGTFGSSLEVMLQDTIR